MKLKPHRTWNLPIISIGTWIDRAACKHAPLGEMVPKQWTATGDRVHPVTYDHAVARAKQWCAICTVATPCRDYGLAISAHVEDHGIYGGLTMEERNEILGYQTVFLPRVGGIRECGTGAAYQRHIRNREQVCAECRAWKSNDTRRRRQARRDSTLKSNERPNSGESSETKRRRRRTRNRQDSQ